MSSLAQELQKDEGVRRRTVALRKRAGVISLRCPGCPCRSFDAPARYRRRKLFCININMLSRSPFVSPVSMLATSSTTFFLEPLGKHRCYATLRRGYKGVTKGGNERVTNKIVCRIVSAYRSSHQEVSHQGTPIHGVSANQAHWALWSRDALTKIRQWRFYDRGFSRGGCSRCLQTCCALGSRRIWTPSR